MAERYDVFIGTYNQRGSEGIYRFAFDSETGKLEPQGLAAPMHNASFLALHPAGRTLYAVSEAGQSGSVTAFAIDLAAGALQRLSEQSTHGSGPCHVAVDPTGRAAVAANYGGGSVAAFPLDDAGNLGPAGSAVQHVGSSVHPRRQGEPHAHSINVHPSGRFAVAADLGIDKLMVYRLDPALGTLTPADPPFTATAPGSGPRHLAFHPSGRFAFVIHELDNTLSVLAVDPAQPTLTPVQTVSTLPDGWEGPNTTAEVQVHPTGRFVYGSNRGHDSIAVFRFDEAAGKLECLQHQPTQGRNPRHFGVSPDGRWLLAANQDTDTLVPFRIDPADGTIKPASDPTPIAAPVCVVYSGQQRDG